MTKSQFGRGLTYCLGLFLEHGGREISKFKLSTMVWFNGAGDHLYDLEVPDTLPKYLQNRLRRFQNKVIEFRIGKPTEEDKWECLAEAKDLLRLIDKAHGIKTEKGEYQ